MTSIFYNILYNELMLSIDIPFLCVSCKRWSLKEKNRKKPQEIL